jgi:ABC-type Fe3+/spermidine/putrescine transport system ATPase subunit
MAEVTDSVASRLSGEPLLRVRGLTKIYGESRVVDDVSFELFPGEVLTLLGPSGCGKSTTLRMIAGLERPDGGEVWVRGRLVASGEGRVMVPPEARNVGLVFQSYAIWPHMTVAENIAYPLKVRGLTREGITAKVDEMIRLVKLDGLGPRMSTELSGGQQQRVALARALIYEPDLLLLDEPLSNLDYVLRKEMRVQLKALQSRFGTSTLYVTHDQEEAMSLSSRVAVMNLGRIEQIDPPVAVYERPSSRFVHGFVGQTVRLSGIVSGDTARVRVGARDLCVDAAASAMLTHGATVEITIRPEDVALKEACGAGDNGVYGRVEETTYYGDRVECAIRVEAAGDQIVVVNVGKERRLVPGDRVFLEFDRARIMLWPPSAS